MGAAMRLSPDEIPSFNSDGTVIDLGYPDPELICIRELANTLSKIARFDGRNLGPAFSVGQHSVMGAKAILNEGGTPHEAALFLFHDGHEWALGDQTRPVQRLYQSVAIDLYGQDRIRDTIAACKAAWGEAIYVAAGLPGPEAWTKRQAKIVKDMDDRMCRAEAIALFGPRAAEQFPDMPTPKLTGAIRPWAAMKAEEQFLSMAATLIGQERILDQANLVALRRAL